MLRSRVGHVSGLSYAPADLERFLSEDERPGRSPFERDRARIVHSAALRRLAAKTQVVGPESHDFVRNRLTHTLEVAQVGGGIANVIGCDVDVVEAACLAHDLGHPPFGHNGERALNDAAEACGGFEGNAQTLRLLTRLEAKRTAPDGSSVGLNLTRATLDASVKYPWSWEEAAHPAGRHADGLPRAVRKFGVYADDLPVFEWLREEAVSRRTPIEAQVMDVADDVAYSVHDVEDGVVAGRIDLARMSDSGIRSHVWATTRDWYTPQYDEATLDAAFERLAAEQWWPTTSYDGSRRQLAGLKDLASRLINRFCLAVEEEVRRSDLPTPLVRYAADLPVPGAVREEMAVLKGIAAHFVMKADDRVDLLVAQRELLLELVDALWKVGGDHLEPALRTDFSAADDDSARRRVIIDQVASLTDASAVEWHRRLGSS